MKRAILAFIVSTLLAVAVSAQLPVCNVAAQIFDVNGQPRSNFRITVVRVVKNGQLISNTPSTYTTNASGQVTIPIPQASTAWVYANAYNLDSRGAAGVPLTIPASGSAQLETLVQLAGAFTALTDIFTTQGDTVYGGVNGVATRLAGSIEANLKFFGQLGTGTASAAPAWYKPVAGSNVTFSFDHDAKTWTINSTGGGGGGSLLTREVDGTPSITTTSTLEFAQANGFVLTDQGSGVARLDLSAIPFSALATLTANRALATNGSGAIVVSGVSDTELGYLGGVTSAIQTQLNARALNARTLTAGTGLIGGGDLSADRTFDIGSGTGITVNANDIAINQAFTPTWTGLHTFNTGTTPGNVVLLDIAAIGSTGTRDSHNITLRGRSDDGSGHAVEWKEFVDVTSNGGASTYTIQSRIDSGSFTDRLTVTDGGAVTATSFSGDGSALTALNADNLSSGTLPSGRFPALTGDVTTSAGSVSTTIASDAVTFAKFQNITDNRLLGRSAGSSGDMQEITVGSGLSLSGGTLSTSGTINAGVAKRVAFYPSSSSAVDDASGFEYQASGSPMILLDGQTATDPVLVVREGTASSTVPLIGGFPALATIQTTDINNYWNLAYANDAASSGWANYLTNGGELLFENHLISGGTTQGYLGFLPAGTINLFTTNGGAYYFTRTTGVSNGGSLIQTATSEFHLAFGVSNDPTTHTKSLTWTDVGVGINKSSSPGAQLHVVSGSTSRIAAQIDGDASATADLLRVRKGTSNRLTVAESGQLTVTGRTINTDADNTVAVEDSTFSITKNDVNTRTFHGLFLKPTLNTGGSNTNTTLNLVSVDTTNTATTGLTTNLLRLAYGGAQQFVVTSGGAVTATSFSGSGASLTSLNASNISTGTLGSGRLDTDVVQTDQANTWSTGAQDFGSATSLKVPTSGGAAPTSDGLLAYDSTCDCYVGGQSGATIQLSTWPLSSYVLSKPGSSQVVLRFVFDRAMNIPSQSNGTNAYVKAGTAANAQTDFTMSKNGAASFCTLRFAASGTQATFQASCASTDFAAGDVLTIIAPSSQDSALADIGFSITAKMK